ncbi:cutinase family protein [Nocardioides sp.]|uniref:cutinase family protein n=1 Tax=Nocardioides sp. TaxID=35761 RepID=UPI003513CA63
MSPAPRDRDLPTARPPRRARRILALTLGVSGALAVLATPPLPASAATDSCAEVIVYVVRGSGEAPQTGPGAQPYDPTNPTAGYGATWDAFDPVDPATGTSGLASGTALTGDPDTGYSPATSTPFLYDLVQQINARTGGQLRLSWTPIRYPAIAVPRADLSIVPWAAGGYSNSVTSGIRELHRTLQRQWESCGTATRYVLAGYSQGADVVNSYLRGEIVNPDKFLGQFRTDGYLAPSREVTRQIAAVALIADPNHDPRAPESMSDLDPGLARKGGLTDAITPGLPKSVRAVADSLCLAGDGVCGQGTVLPDEAARRVHSRGYRDADEFPVACVDLAGAPTTVESGISCLADRVVERLGVRNLVLDPPDDAASAPGTTGRDVVFVIDTTGSMSDNIDDAITFARTEADRILALDSRVALLEYRDSGDSPPAQVVVDFTDDVGVFESGLLSLTATGGDDTPEGLLHALMLGFDTLDWTYGATKAAVVLTDAPFHEPDRTGGETLPQVERRALEIDPVNVFPVVPGRLARPYRDLAARTSGQVIPLDRDATTSLSAALDDIAARPTVVLDDASYYVAAGREVHFDASASTAAEGELVSFLWDVDGDGFTDETTTGPTLTHTYTPGYRGVMQVVAVDDRGRSANASASVAVEAEPTRGLVPRVPNASDLTARAQRRTDDVLLDVSWRAGDQQPLRWVVTVDGDPVRILDGDAREARVPVDFREGPWEVALVPMDADGNLGTPVVAALEPIGRIERWYRRPVVWGAGAVGGALTLVGLALVLLRTGRRRRPTATPPVPGTTGGAA